MKTIGIINIIYGGLGILGGIITILVLIIQMFVFGFLQHNLPPMSSEDYEIMMKVQDAYTLNFFIVPVSILIATLFLISGIRILKKNISGVKLAISASISSIAFYFISAGLVWFMFLQKIFATIPGVDIQKLGYFYLAIIIVAGVFNIGYPVFQLIYLKKEKFLKYFE
ncbi:MAG: hypothetical protein Kow0068_08120 [Marinilabiliales bacterium]